MAFTGTPVVKLVSERKVRITGLSLHAGQAGTISCHAGTGQVKLPSQFLPEPYGIGPSRSAHSAFEVTLQDSVECRWNNDGAISTQVAIECVKTGTTEADFLITLTENDVELNSAELEIWVEFH